MSRSIYARLFHRYAPPERVELVVSRREVLKAAAAVTAGAMLSGCAGSAASRRRAGGGLSSGRIAIIGAGFAGLACAYELRSAGYDVTVFEARRRVGGRVLSFTDMVPGGVAEGGGELIGTNHPTWMAYARHFGLEMLEITEPELSYPVMLDGELLSDEESEALYEALDEACNRFNEHARLVNEDEPWRTSRAAEWDALSTGDAVRALELDPRTRHALVALFEADNGCPIGKQSYLGNLTQIKGGGVETYWTDSENRRCAGGNQQLAFRLLEAVGPERVYLGTPVERIEVGDRLCRVTTAGGGASDFDDVVLAVPPTVWSRIQLSPGLPAGLTPQMGSNVKYLAKVRKRFWVDEGKAADAFSDGPVHMTWETTDNQELPADAGAVMVGFSGAAASEACRAVPARERDEFYARHIGRFYEGYRDNFVSSRFMDWPSDEWARASYSFPAPRQITTIGRTLRDGLGRLHFAGEHTCYKFVGYMEGALNSGVDLAKRLAVRDGVAAAN